MTRPSIEPGGSAHPTRRQFLQRAANGFAMLPLAHLARTGDGALVRHHAPRARSVIFLYMDGGPSAQDLFDHKPRLVADHGKPFALPKAPTQFNDDGNTTGPCATFRQHGDSGQWISDLLPHLAGQADRLCVVRSMVADFSEHTNANYFLHTGHGLQGRPSFGTWIGYGLGSDAADLPAYVVLNGGLVPPGGIDNFGAGFLPAHAQGSVFRMRGEAVANIAPREADPSRQRRQLELARALDAHQRARLGAEPALDAAIRNHELAFRMQAAVPELLALDGEAARLRTLYGCDDDYEPTRTFARQCMLARRLVERGVRFVQLTCPDTGHDRWDQHNNLAVGLRDNCRMVDRPIAALLADLSARGLLDETIVLWGGEFGRTPFAQGSSGRDHNPFGFTMWMCGGGFRAGHSHGATDEFGYRAAVDPVTIHDLHATLLWQLGIDHERFTYRFGGRDLRLTDVYGTVQKGLLA
ncbi:MAG: DUF1501 domain-containing protein [Planctomycetes bacterium]|nr:DUF1501 domain-containing protein [Planctomycetota bacterium]